MRVRDIYLAAFTSNKTSALVTGTVCGVRVEDGEDPAVSARALQP